MRPVKSKKFSLIGIRGLSLSVQSVCVLCISGTSCRATQRNHQTGSTIATRAYDYLKRVDAEWEQPHTYAACKKAADPGQTIVQIRVLPVCTRMRVGTTLRQAHTHYEACIRSTTFRQATCTIVDGTTSLSQWCNRRYLYAGRHTNDSLKSPRRDSTDT